MGGPREGAYAGRSRAEPAAQAALAARGREGARFQLPAGAVAVGFVIGKWDTADRLIWLQREARFCTMRDMATGTLLGEQMLTPPF